MVIEYQDAVLPQPPIPPSPYSPPTRPSILNNADSVDSFNPGNISIVMPHNFTTGNGYEYRDGTIYKPDGTKLFGSN